MAVIKVKSTHPESQGPYVLLDEEDFDKEKHELYVEVEPEGGAEPKKAKGGKSKVEPEGGAE